MIHERRSRLLELQQLAEIKSEMSKKESIGCSNRGLTFAGTGCVDITRVRDHVANRHEFHQRLESEKKEKEKRTFLLFALKDEYLRNISRSPQRPLHTSIQHMHLRLLPLRKAV